MAGGHSNLLPSMMAHFQLTFMVNSGARIRPGKAALLESIRETGSISAAARAMGMDYKRAWLLIDSLNRAFRSHAFWHRRATRVHYCDYLNSFCCSDQSERACALPGILTRQ
jgi:Bacterial regulatory helix-turn-helix protein, lysR family